MKKIGIWLLTISCTLCVSCVDVEEHDDTPVGNFEALWKIVDEHYCFFDYKQQEYGLDWNTVYSKYKVRVNNNMKTTQLFEVCCDMLGELRDGHVNLTSSMDYGRYWAWHEAYPKNFSDTLYRHYMGTDYRISSGLNFRILDDNIGYVYCPTFETAIGEGQKTLTGYMQHKTGPGHSDFSEMKAQYLEPSKNLRWNKKVCVLTNRSVFSAANAFAVMMHALPNVTLVGDHTGGGGGMPLNSSLPNGWNVRFSACPLYDKDARHTEFGIAPDVAVNLTAASIAQDKDDIIEKARELLLK